MRSRRGNTPFVSIFETSSDILKDSSRSDWNYTAETRRRRADRQKLDSLRLCASAVKKRTLGKNKRAPRRESDWSAGRPEGLSIFCLALHVLCKGRHMLGHRIMLHQKFPKLRATGDHKINRLIDPPRRKIHRANQMLCIRRDAQMLVIMMRRQDLKLPRLPPIDVPQAALVDLQFAQ